MIVFGAPVLAIVAPAPPLFSTSAPARDFTVVFRPTLLDPVAPEVDGTMNVRETRGGRLVGRYRSENRDRLVPVRGGVDPGGSIWLEFGSGGSDFKVSGRVAGDTIAGSGYGAGTPYTFTAVSAAR